MDYTLTGDALEVAENLKVNYGATLTVENDVTVTGNTVVGEDSALTVSGGSLTTENVEAAAGVVTVVDGATLTAQGTVEAGSLIVDTATLTAQGDVVTVNLEVAEASTLTAASATVKTLDNKGTLSIAGVLTATAPAATYSLRSADVAQGTIENSGDMTVGGVAADAFTMTGGTLEITTEAGFQSGSTNIAAGTLKADSVDWSIDGATIGAVTIEGDKKITLSNVSLTETLENDGNLELSGTIDVSNLEYKSTSVFTTLDGELTEDGNGYASTTNIYTVVTGNAAIVDEANVQWVSGSEADYIYNSGILTEKLEFSHDTYVVNTDVAYTSALNTALKANDTKEILAAGGNLAVNTAMVNQKLTVDGGAVDVKAAVTKEISLKSGQLNINASVSGIKAQGGTINIGAGATGEVKVTGSKVDITGGNGSAGLSIGKGVVAGLNLDSTTVTADAQGVTLNGTLSNGVLSVTEGAQLAGNLVLDNSTLSIATTQGDLNLTEGEVGSILKDGLVSLGSMTVDADNIQLTGTGVDVYAKYFSGWTMEDGKVVATGRNTSFYTDKAGAAVTANGAAGLALADAALVNQTKGKDLNNLLNRLDGADAAESDKLGASLAGASTAVLGMAAMGDVERQLKAIRNRTTTMGVDQSVANDDMPYFNAWINAEGDRSELGENGTESGYELNSWGGTVGFDVDFCPTVTAGMALTAMYGDLDATGADTATGSMDSYYVSVFARYAPSAWTHTFVGTIGTSDISLDRTVNGVQLEGETSGMSFGFMYEVGRVFALDEDGTACLQPVFNVTWRHSTVDGYTEDGSDLALEVGEQTLDTITFGMGARLQSVVGESMYNRTSILEARVLAKVDAGDRCGSSKVALGAVPGASSSVDSTEMGAFGLEAGAGLTIPVGQDGGSIFMDASVELRSDYTNVNGTVGYRINF